ncbi:MAG: hypothetical protein R6U28_00100 [Cyclonatronaceae bacterium]
MDLWFFLTVAVIVWGVVELVQTRSKNKLQKQMESGENDRKKYGERIERLERRITNLETIVVDEEAGSSAGGSGANGPAGADEEHERHQPGTMANKLK